MDTESFPGHSAVAAGLRTRVRHKVADLTALVSGAPRDFDMLVARSMVLDLVGIINVDVPALIRADAPTDIHAEDFHVYIDGAMRFRVPCGVCGGKTDSTIDNIDHDERKRLNLAYGVKSPALRETVRQHLEDAVTMAHPGSQVTVS